MLTRMVYYITLYAFVIILLFFFLTILLLFVIIIISINASSLANVGNQHQQSDAGLESSSPLDGSCICMAQLFPTVPLAWRRSA